MSAELWVRTTLGEITTWLSGGTPPKSEPRFWGGSIPWISASSMKTLRLNDSEERITEAGLESGSRLAPPNCPLLLVRGSELHKRIPIGIAPKPVAFNQDVKALIPKKDVDPDFLLYWLLAHRDMLRTRVEHTGIGAGKLDTQVVMSLPVMLPTIVEQKLIAEFFKAIDDKIELDRRMNKTLEAITRAIFKWWFVQFSAVPARDLVKSELGRIPKGWQVASVGDHIEATKGLSYKGEGLCSEGMPMHNLNSIYEGGGYKYEGIKYYTGEFRNRHLLKTGDIIVANTEQGFDYLLIGYPAIVPRYFGGKGLFTHHLFHVMPHPSSPVTRYFLYYLLMTPSVRDQVIGCTNGTTVNALSSEGLTIPRFALPPAALIRRFDTIAASIHQMIETNVETNKTLSCLRDALLPKLLSGEIRTKEVQEMLAAAH